MAQIVSPYLLERRRDLPAACQQVREVRGLPPASCESCDLFPVCGRPLQHPLSQHSDDEIDRALQVLGKDRCALFSPGPGNAPHRQRMARMMAHCGVSPNFAVRHYWDALRQADQACVECHNLGRCKIWLGCPIIKSAPQRFCPNAATFAAIAFAERRGRTDPAIRPVQA